MGRIPASQRLFNVIGTFAANSEVDGDEMLVNIEDAWSDALSGRQYYRLAFVAG